MNRYATFATAAAVGVVADQASKAAARAWLVPERIQPFIGGFWDWQLSYNRGIAFSIGDGAGWPRALFAVVAAVACVAIVIALRRGDGRRLAAAALGLVFAGALGNLVDRVLAGQVTDFILWRVGEHRWPRFNVADAALVVGVAVMILTPRPKSRPS